MRHLHRPHLPLITEPVRRTEAGAWTIELLPPAAYDTRYVAGQSAVGFAFDYQRGTHAIGSDRVRPFEAIPNGLAFVPAGCDVFSRSPQGGEYLRVIRTDGKPLADIQPFSNVIDPQAISIAQRMRKALLGASPEDDWEAWAFALVEQATGIDELSHQPRKPMPAKRLRLLDEYIDEGLDGPLTVPEMAELLGLSEGYFMRTFRDTTGQSPHSYLIDRRLARARSLLCNSANSLVDIAQVCGFSSQAHMTTAFRQRLGLSPGKLRG